MSRAQHQAVERAATLYGTTFIHWSRKIDTTSRARIEAKTALARRRAKKKKTKKVDGTQRRSRIGHEEEKQTFVDLEISYAVRFRFRYHFRSRAIRKRQWLCAMNKRWMRRKKNESEREKNIYKTQTPTHRLALAHGRENWYCSIPTLCSSIGVCTRTIRAERQMKKGFTQFWRRCRRCRCWCSRRRSRTKQVCAFLLLN